MSSLCAKLLVLSTTFTSAHASGALNATSDLNTDDSIQEAAPCLCIFDVDRTLTAAQGDTKRCNAVEVDHGIYDDAYGGGPLTLSHLGANLDKTFCKSCYAGVISHGDADGGAYRMRPRLAGMLNKNKAKHLTVANEWSTAAADGSVKKPLVVKVDNAKKHAVAHGIRDWYWREKKISFSSADVYFFDDIAINVKEFEGSKYNVHQVSCTSRDASHHDDIGYCGGNAAEVGLSKFTGVRLCQHENERSMDQAGGDAKSTAIIV